MRRASSRAVHEGPLSWLLPLLLVPVALLPNLKAALPLASYYFRDFTVAFFPQRQFAARELAEGRLPLWNPYFFEGSFQLPSFYPLELLHVLWPSPVFVSWLLTLHLPLAALAAYWLARELGASRLGGFAAGAVFALGGLALSSLNLYIFLQALALAPFVAGWLRRAARDGGRAVAIAGGVLALALSTLAVEFVLQAALLGCALGLAERPERKALARLAGAGALGAGLCGLPIALTLAILPETPRGAGMAGGVTLANALHPAVLVQVLLPGLFGVPQAPADAFWGGRFFSKGMPYFFSLYLGPLVLALAAAGITGLPRRVRLVVLGLAAIGLWYALGERAGLAALVARLPFAAAFRFPSKALLLPHLAVALAAGFGADRLRGGQARGVFAGALAASAVVAVFVAVLLAAPPAGLVDWTGVTPSFWPHLSAEARQEAGVVVVLALVAGAVVWSVGRGLLSPARASALLVALAVADLVRAGAGLNPQVHASFFDPLPEMTALQLDQLDGTRVFSYGLDHSPAFSELLQRGGQALTLTSFYVYRQMLGPYTSVLDRVETAEANDLTSIVPRERELRPDDYDPARAAELLPWFRNAGVSRVLSLDPLSHAELVPLASVPVGPPGVSIYVYGFDSWPRAALACRATVAATREEARDTPYRSGFDPWREVAVEERGSDGPDDALAATCTKGRARRSSWSASEEHYEVESNASAYLVVRASYARGWRAEVDGVPTPVVRANGKHRAIAVNAGRHEVVLRYHPPGLLAGSVLSLVSLVAALAVLLLGSRRAAR